MSQPEVVKRPTFRERFSRGLSENQKVILYGAGLAGALGLGYVLVKNLSAPGAVGGGCNDPGSPCYQAIQPYQQGWQRCANSQAYYQHQFDLENATAKTGLTQDQINTLNYYQNCMDQQAAGLAKAASAYVPKQGMQDFLANIGDGIAVAVVVGVGLHEAPNIIRTLRTPSSSGSAMTSNFANSVVRDEIDSGVITAEDAAAFRSSLALRTAMFQAGDTAFYDSLVVQESLTQLEASAIAESISSAIAADAEETDTLLGAL